MKSREKRRRRQLRKLHRGERLRSCVEVRILWETLRYLALEEAEAGRSL